MSIKEDIKRCLLKLYRIHRLKKKEGTKCEYECARCCLVMYGNAMGIILIYHHRLYNIKLASNKIKQGNLNEQNKEMKLKKKKKKPSVSNDFYYVRKSIVIY